MTCDTSKTTYHQHSSGGILYCANGYNNHYSECCQSVAWTVFLWSLFALWFLILIFGCLVRANKRKVMIKMMEKQKEFMMEKQKELLEAQDETPEQPEVVIRQDIITPKP